MNRKIETVKTSPVLIDGIAPSGDFVTDMDVKLFPVYVSLLDMKEENVDWQSIASDLLQIDPLEQPDSAKARYESFYNRAVWMTKHGYKQISKKTNPKDMFQAWARAILVNLVAADKIYFDDKECSEVESWASETIDGLVATGDLVADPAMSPEQCAEKLILLTKHRH